MSKEKLKEINRIARHKVLGNIKGEIRYRLTEINTEDYEWLIEQAERAKHYEQVLENMQREIHKAAYEQAKRYKQALEHIQREIHKAIYTPKKQKWNSDFEREFESGKTRGLIQASDIVKEGIEILEGEE